MTNTSILSGLAVKSHNTNSRRGRCCGRARSRRGNVLVLLAVSLSSMLAVVGLVLDTGLLLSGTENLRHAADAAAMAAAKDLQLGKSSAQATVTATNYIQGLNGMADATVVVNIPPTQGPYVGQSNYVEVIATRVYQLQLMQVVAASPLQSYQVRSVAGYTSSTSGAAIDVLDPNPPWLSINALPPTVPAYSTLIGGLEVLGGGTASVNGAVLVNTTWGGVDENGNPAGTSGGPPYGISCTPLISLTHLNARDIRVVGGVDSTSNYGSYVSSATNPLRANQLAVPDPYASLPVPTTSSDPANVSTQTYGGVQVVQIPFIGGTKVLNPGVYDWIEIDSGTVVFNPGIYIIRSVNPLTGVALNIVAGTVTANGVMFYVTNSTAYDPMTGLPDSNDGNTSPAAPAILNSVPSVVINAALPGSSFSPLASPSSPFNGMLIYQRRADFSPVAVVQQSLLGSSPISGAIYAKWGQALFVGIGTYDVTIAAGTVRLVTVLGMTLSPTTPLPAAQDVFLVE